MKSPLQGFLMEEPISADVSLSEMPDTLSLGPDLWEFLGGDIDSFLGAQTPAVVPLEVTLSTVAPSPEGLSRVDEFFDITSNFYYIPFIHKSLFMSEYKNGNMSPALLSAMMAFTATSERETVEMVERARTIAQGNVRDLVDLYRSTQALILVIVLQCKSSVFFSVLTSFLFLQNVALSPLSFPPRLPASLFFFQIDRSHWLPRYSFTTRRYIPSMRSSTSPMYTPRVK